MKRRFRWSILCLAGLGSPWSLQAQDALQTGLAACAELTDGGLRLDCFDALAGMSADDAHEADRTASAVAAGADTARTFPVGSQTVDAPAAPPPDPSDPPESAAPPANRDLFGLEARATEGINQVQSRYVGHFEGWSGETKFPLENGQVWRQAERGTLAWSADSPMITIEKAWFGSFRLRVEGLNQSVRVERVE